MALKNHLLSNRHLHVTIYGYTDREGSKNYNLDLGRRRAESVKSLLVSYGVKEKQVITRSFGELSASQVETRDEDRKIVYFLSE